MDPTEMSQIFPRLWIAPADTVREVAFLKEHGITHVLNCAAEEPASYPKTVVSRHVPLTDTEDEDAYAQILFGAKLLDVWLRNVQNTIVVHCKAGISRSVAVVMAWFILYDNRTFEEAYEMIQTRRMFIFPNSHYVKLLRGLEGWATNGLRDYL